MRVRCPACHHNEMHNLVPGHARIVRCVKCGWEFVARCDLEIMGLVTLSINGVEKEDE